jgi:hypothetical protein
MWRFGFNVSRSRYFVLLELVVIVLFIPGSSPTPAPIAFDPRSR